MHYALAPGNLQPSQEFCLIAAPSGSSDARGLLERFSPLGNYAGEVDTPSADSGVLQVLVSPDWIRYAFGDAREEYRDVTALLLPDGNIWGYSEFARSLVGWPSTEPKGHVSYAEAAPHLTRWGKATLDGERFGSVHKDTLQFLQMRAEPHTRTIDAVTRRFADVESRRTYHRLITGTVDDLFHDYRKHVFRSVQYFECLHWRPGMVILNGGVKEGFELPYFVALCEGDATVLNIDPGGFDQLSDFARRTAEYFPERIIACPYALWSESGQQTLPVSSDGVVLSQYKGRNIHNFQEIHFECRSIDDVVAEHGLERVDLVKLDVEGAEPAVLEGMWRTIERHRPQLAISIYHWPEHMWELPIQLMTRLEGYDFYLRHYSYGRWECVLYGIPRELQAD